MSDARPPNYVPDAELLAELRRVGELDASLDPPGADDMYRYGAHSKSTYTQRFGGWNEALEAAGYDPDAARNAGAVPVATEALLAELWDLRLALGRAPTTEDMRHQGQFCVNTYTDRFGGWYEALLAGGLDPAYLQELGMDQGVFRP